MQTRADLRIIWNLYWLCKTSVVNMTKSYILKLIRHLLFCHAYFHQKSEIFRKFIYFTSIQLFTNYLYIFQNIRIYFNSYVIFNYEEYTIYFIFCYIFIKDSRYYTDIQILIYRCCILNYLCIMHIFYELCKALKTPVV